MIDNILEKLRLDEILPGFTTLDGSFTLQNAERIHYQLDGAPR